MTDQLADELVALAKDAAALPWCDTERDQNGQVVIKDGDNLELATLWHHCVGSLEKQSHHNAALIVALRNNLPAILSALREREVMREALRKAEQFIVNGADLGFIRLPETADDPAHLTLPAIRAALQGGVE